MKKSLIVKLVALCLISLIAGISIGIASTPSTTFTISSGVYPGASSYTVYNIGSNYYAKDQNGVVNYADTDVTSLLDNVIGDLPSYGGDIYFCAGDYGEDGQYLDIEADNVNFYGAGSAFSPFGEGSTYSPAKVPATCFRFRVSFIECTGGSLHNIGIVPEADRNDEGEAGVMIQASHDIYLDELSIARFDTGILVTTLGEANSYSAHNHILFPLIWNCTYGIILTYTVGGYEHGSEVTQIYGGGIYGYSGDIRCSIGIDVRAADFTTIDNVIFVNCDTAMQVADGPTKIICPSYETVTSKIALTGDAATTPSLVTVLPNTCFVIEMRGYAADNPDVYNNVPATFTEEWQGYRHILFASDFGVGGAFKCFVSLSAQGSGAGTKSIEVYDWSTSTQLANVTWTGSSMQNGLSGYTQYQTISDDVGNHGITLRFVSNSSETISLYGATFYVEQLYGSG